MVVRAGAQGASRGTPGPRQMFAAATAQLDELRALIATRGRLKRSDRSLALVLSYPTLRAAGHPNSNGNGHG